MTLSMSEPAIHHNNVIVDFGAAFPSDVQGKALLALEKYLRHELGMDAEVYKKTMPDDNKRRRDMTPEQRDKL